MKPAGGPALSWGWACSWPFIRLTSSQHPLWNQANPAASPRQRGTAAATSCAILTFVDMMCFSFDSGTEGSRVVIVLLFIQSVNTVRKCIYLIFKGQCVVFQFFLCYKRLGTKLCCFAVALKQNCLIELGTTVSVLIMFLMWKLLHFAWLGEKNYKNVFVFSFFCIISINVFFSHVLLLLFVSVDLLNWDVGTWAALSAVHTWTWAGTDGCCDLVLQK